MTGAARPAFPSAPAPAMGLGAAAAGGGEIQHMVSETGEQLSPIGSRPSLIDTTYDRLVDAIATDRLPPGARLNQRDLADQLMVSRQPISHALHRLKAAGLAVESGRKGLVVAPVDTARLTDLYDLRAEIEGLVAERAAAKVAGGKADAEEIDRLETMLAAGTRIDGTTPILDCITADVAFHLCLYRLCGSAVISETIEPLWPHFRRSMGRALSLEGHRRVSWRGHEAIATAILAGQPEAAREAMRAHIRTARETTLGRLASRA